MSRSTLTFLLKTLVSLGILAFLFSRINTAQLVGALTSARLSYLAVALAGYFLGQLLCSVRWGLLARPLGFENGAKDFAIFYFIGMFFNLFAPSTIGGDVGRVFYLARGGRRKEGQQWTGATLSALISVLADRIIGLVVLVWIGAAALALFSNYDLPLAVRTITFALAACSILGWLLLAPLHRLAERWGVPRAKNLLQGLATYTGNHWTIVVTVVISLIAHVIQSWMHILLGRSLGVEIPWSYVFILYPLVGIFSSLPVSLNGIGLREGGYLFLLGQIDVSPEKAIAFSFLWLIIVALDSLIGGVVFVLKKSPKPSTLVPVINDQTK
ncbi:MAG: flippase-like domain-containing protein [Deltaproteobacteria bacterium]|nr:flippase-like domain-containing protein [Deltaproteobacteria bacterium]